MPSAMRHEHKPASTSSPGRPRSGPGPAAVGVDGSWPITGIGPAPRSATADQLVQSQRLSSRGLAYMSPQLVIPGFRAS
jgi:hypothetical protein